MYVLHMNECRRPPLYCTVWFEFFQFSSALSQLPGDETPRAGRSRASSISSVTSDSFFTNTSFGSQHHYVLPSDIESEVEEQASSLEVYSKDDLYQLVRKYERRAVRYKSKFMEVWKNLFGKF